MLRGTHAGRLCQHRERPVDVLLAERGHEPGEWMSSDFADLMPQTAAAGCRAVVVVLVLEGAGRLSRLPD